VAIEFDVTFIAIACIISVAGFLSVRVLTNTQTTGSKYLKLKLKELEDYSEYLKKQNRVYKSKIGSIERGPNLEGDINELSTVLPQLVSEFGDFVPKWLKPFINDPKMQEWILKYVQDNPDKAKDWFSRIVKKKGSDQEEKTDDASESV